METSIASLRITVTSTPRRLSDWYRFQVNESKLSIIRMSRGRDNCGGSDIFVIKSCESASSGCQRLRDVEIIYTHGMLYGAGKIDVISRDAGSR